MKRLFVTLAIVACDPATPSAAPATTTTTIATTTTTTIATATATASAAPRSSSGPWGIAHTPRDVSRPRPVVLYMHGMWASPEDSCSFFEEAAAPHGFLVCARGNAPLGAGNMWGGADASVAARVGVAIDAADALAPGMVDRTAPGTLIGFSNGAAYAVRIALAQPGRWSGLVLMAMDLVVDAERLKRAGIARIVFAAGDLDGSRASLERASRAANTAGLPSRYVSLGPVGHHFAKDMVAKMTDAIAWVREAPDAAP